MHSKLYLPFKHYKEILKSSTFSTNEQKQEIFVSLYSVILISMSEENTLLTSFLIPYQNEPKRTADTTTNTRN